MDRCLNIEVLNELVDIMGDDMGQLLNSYIADSQNKLKSLAKMNLATEQEAIFRMAHSLKGSSRNVGVAQFSNYCEQIELLAREENLTANDFDLAVLNKLFEQAAAQLTERYL